MITETIESYARAVYAALSRRPILALTLGYLATGFVAGMVEAYQKEKDRIATVVATTVAELDARSDEIEARMSNATREEINADYDPALWGEGVPS